MRRRIGLWLVLVGVAITLSLWRGRPRVAGAELLGVLEARKGPMRGALMLLDYVPDAAALQGLRTEDFRRGAGSLPGQGLTAEPGQHWVVAPGLEFTWRAPEGEGAIRTAIAENGAARVAMSDVLVIAGYYQEAAQRILQAAGAKLNALNDEDLLLAWLRADRAVMAQSDDPERATREGLLLAARQNGGPAILFAPGGGGQEQVYLLPMDGAPRRDSPAAWVQMEAYEKHRLKWTGVLRLEGAPEAERVRTMAARMAEFAGGAR